jgi:magnesium chelatase subunit I
MNKPEINNLKELKASGYKAKSIKDELSENLSDLIRSGKTSFPNIYGYENTVIPDLERAILSKHNINFLGLRGQAKTRLARMMVKLLDEWIPIIKGSEINDDPLAPISSLGKKILEDNADDTEVDWLHRDERFF